MIRLTDISKRFGNYQALKGIDLDIPSGELVALLGPSGSGKTSLLRIIAGLEGADEGSIRFDADEGNELEKNVGFVFQHYALFKHMTVFENVAYGLKVKKRKDRLPKKVIREKVLELLKLVRLEGFADRYPSQLSGGQRQRVALARTLAVEPKILLLDEPFGALDAKVRKELRRWLRRLHDEVAVTTIFVTHDQEEALDVADRIVILNDGKIIQEGSPDEVYHHPNSPFVYNFLGDVNLFKGRLEKGKLHQGVCEWEINGDIVSQSETAVGFVRPHDISISRDHALKDSVPAWITYIQAFGKSVRIELKRQDSEEYLEAELSREQFTELRLQIKELVFVKPNQLHVFTPDDYVI
ncbi:sulfate/molybdate ABC transporter ATP-binding protein [Sporosarcina cascadiensis]|uniref:sulfate/molybdate ABC transporter ATP-binding protein n=1 Tax=Sporosarcina cascadiensis TaxID=2660747 RepID=UPI00129A0EE8|nr:sulfate/molybdate ABC transporter ATP-binding protein [Sporosarcina cascadiensis]